MSWLFSRALVEEYLADTCSDGEPSAPSNATATPQAYLSQDKMKAFSRLSRFGMTFKPLMDDLGGTLLTWYLGAFRAKTSPAQEEVQASPDSAADSGQKWLGSFARYDLVTSSWKTHQYSLAGDLTEYSETWPRWGLMRDGECSVLPTWERRTSETESGLWPTPTTFGGGANHNSPCVLDGRHRINLAGAVMQWATPVARDYRSPGQSWLERTGSSQGDPLNTQVGGVLNPTWVEWLMGWPLGWTDLRPLEMDKFQQWQQQHSQN
jgi:hypothetical protein